MNHQPSPMEAIAWGVLTGQPVATNPAQASELIANENREAAKAARAWRPSPRTSPDLDDIDDNDVRSVMLSMALANFDDCRDKPDELAFYARCIHAYMRDNGSWTRVCIDDAARLMERRIDREEDVILVKAEENGREAYGRELSPIVSLRATVATIRALKSIEDRQDPRAAWLFAQLAKPNNGFPSIEECRREAMELERMEDAKAGGA